MLSSQESQLGDMVLPAWLQLVCLPEFAHSIINQRRMMQKMMTSRNKSKTKIQELFIHVIPAGKRMNSGQSRESEGNNAKMVPFGNVIIPVTEAGNGSTGQIERVGNGEISLPVFGRTVEYGNEHYGPEIFCSNGASSVRVGAAFEFSTFPGE